MSLINVHICSPLSNPLVLLFRHFMICHTNSFPFAISHLHFLFIVNLLSLTPRVREKSLINETLTLPVSTTLVVVKEKLRLNRFEGSRPVSVIHFFDIRTVLC